MDSSSTLTEALLSAAVVAAFFYIVVRCLRRVVVWARRGSKKAFVVGAALAPFIALGNVGDPEFRIVQEAKRLKNREDDNPGDPPDPEDDGILRTATELAAKKSEHGAIEEARGARVALTLGSSSSAESGRAWVGGLLLLYLAASLLHFTHNAEYLADYPNLPAWLGRSDVYLVWLVLAAVGVGGYALYRTGWRLAGLVLIGAYAVSGFDGLLHYTRAPLAVHTATMNFTIWLEVVAAALLLCAVIASMVKARDTRLAD
jgi:hypothetical protein